MRVSVICTCFNKGAWIAQALDGILAQECSFDYEVIVVDDASSDDSPQIIRAYEERHPGVVRGVFHSQNQGITRTWLEVCELAGGDYIARCDGDDYWCDPHKLRKQVEALEASEDSLWCSTDFDIVTAQGDLVRRSALVSGLYPRMTSFEEQLALKGMTMSSTWLVDRELMLEVNRAIAADAVDDTFNIQLELFMRTRLTFLEDSTTAYRLAEESDSHSSDLGRMARRIERLEQTQLEYLEKNAENIDWPTLARLLIAKNNEREVTIYRLEGEQKVATSEYLSSVEADRDALRAENERLFAELTGEIEKLRAENGRIYDELSGMARDLMDQLRRTEAERDELREGYQAVVESKRWKLASKAARLLKKNG